jgi:hypothetical protein
VVCDNGLLKFERFWTIAHHHYRVSLPNSAKHYPVSNLNDTEPQQQQQHYCLSQGHLFKCSVRFYIYQRQTGAAPIVVEVINSYSSGSQSGMYHIQTPVSPHG